MDIMLKEKVKRDIESLDESGLKEVADFMAFLQFRARQPITPARNEADWNETEMAALYAEFADEDRALAEAGMTEYAAGLVREDAAV